MRTTLRQRRGFAHGGLAFALAQMALLPALALVVFWRGESVPPQAVLPILENEPQIVRPEYDYPLVIDDAQLAMVLKELRPRRGNYAVKINHIDHALRFWGVEATFDDDACLSGERMKRILTDHREFAAVWGERARPLLMQSDNGVAVLTQQGSTSSSHVDHTLATLAECGTPLDQPIVTAQGTSDMRAVLRHALQDFSLNQNEYEWSALACAMYAPTRDTWISKEGQQISYDRIARRIMRQQYGQGCCYGNHRLYTLVMLLRIDDQREILSADARQEAMDHLQDATRRLVASQSYEGYWDQNWHDAGAELRDDGFTPLTRRLLATGHALEWWAMAPRELHPPREVMVRGGQWLVREIEKMNEETIRDNYTFLTHVGRALALWRGDFPAALQQRFGESGTNSR